MSLKGDKYETHEEITMRLQNTIVLYDKEPVYITRIQAGGQEGDDGKEIARVYFRSLPFTGKDGKAEVRKYLSSRNFDLSPFKMGYFNHKGEAHYASRAPVRQNKQGLSDNSVSFTDYAGRNSRNMGFATMVASQGFVDMVHNKYPSFKEAGDLLGDKDTSSVAISRSFAFHIDHDLDALLLRHKGVKCGIAMKSDKALKIPPKFHFLREEMEDHRIPIA